jgi:hypothetical protein
MFIPIFAKCCHCGSRKTAESLLNAKVRCRHCNGFSKLPTFAATVVWLIASSLFGLIALLLPNNVDIEFRSVAAGIISMIAFILLTYFLTTVPAEL